MKKIGCIALSVLLCVILLTSCAAAGKLSDAEIAQLRVQFPLKDAEVVETGDSSDENAMNSFQSIKNNQLQNAICVAKVTLKSVDSFSATEKVGDGYPDEKFNRVYWTVHVDEVITKKTGETLADDVILYVGTQERYGNLLDLPTGIQMVVSITSVPDGVDFPEQKKFYGCPSMISYYVTDDNHILAIYDLPGSKEMDGKTLDAFRQEVKNVF